MNVRHIKYLKTKERNKMDLSLLLNLAIIFFSAKICGMLAERFHMPSVVGEIVAGLILGPSLLNIIQPSDLLNTLAEIGVILLMFSAGLETDLKKMLKSGVKSLIIATVGVIIPLVTGYLLYSAFYGFAPVGDDSFYSAVFTGVIMTATSVSITVSVLKDLGKLSTDVGTAIMGAAIIDDVIGMIVLTFVTGLKTPGTSPIKVIVSTALFFIFAIFAGFIVYKLFAKIEKRYTKDKILSIFAMSLCFIMAFLAEKVFGIADITGAYVAGIMLCNLRDVNYIDENIDVESYLFFTPIFFAGIGIKTVVDNMDSKLLIFTVAFVVVALVSKIIGCGGAAKVLGYNGKDSLRIGIGMMSRGEVGLIVAQKALALGCLSSSCFTAVILMIIISSIVTPILLKKAYSD